MPLAVNGSVSSCSKYSTPTIHTQQHHCALRTRLFFLGPFSCSTMYVSNYSTFYIRQNWREAFWGKQASDSRFLLAKNNVHQTGCFLVLKILFSFFSFFAFSDKFSKQKFWIWGRRSPQNFVPLIPECTRLMSVLSLPPSIPSRSRCRSRWRPAAHCAAVHRDRDAVPPSIAPTPPLPIAIVPPPSPSPIATPSRQRPSPPPPPSIDHAGVHRAAAVHLVPPPIRRCPIAPPPSIAIAPPPSIVIAAAVHLAPPPIAPLPRWRWRRRWRRRWRWRRRRR